MSCEDSPKSIAVSDRATLVQLLTGLNGYTVCAGVSDYEPDGTVVSVPLESNEEIQIGYLVAANRPRSALAERYLVHLKECIANEGLKTLQSAKKGV